MCIGSKVEEKKKNKRSVERCVSTTQKDDDRSSLCSGVSGRWFRPSPKRKSSMEHVCTHRHTGKKKIEEEKIFRLVGHTTGAQLSATSAGGNKLPLYHRYIYTHKVYTEYLYIHRNREYPLSVRCGDFNPSICTSSSPLFHIPIYSLSGFDSCVPSPCVLFSYCCCYSVLI